MPIFHPLTQQMIAIHHIVEDDVASASLLGHHYVLHILRNVQISLQYRQHISHPFLKANRLMLLSIYCDNHTQHTDTLCDKV
jgi:hypothetical protein